MPRLPHPSLRRRPGYSGYPCSPPCSRSSTPAISTRAARSCSTPPSKMYRSRSSRTKRRPQKTHVHSAGISTLSAWRPDSPGGSNSPVNTQLEFSRFAGQFSVGVNRTGIAASGAGVRSLITVPAPARVASVRCLGNMKWQFSILVVHLTVRVRLGALAWRPQPAIAGRRQRSPQYAVCARCGHPRNSGTPSSSTRCARQPPRG